MSNSISGMSSNSVSNIVLGPSGEVTATVDGKTIQVSPEYLMMLVLGNKRKSLTSEFLSQVSAMNENTKKADDFNKLIAMARKHMPSKGHSTTGSSFHIFEKDVESLHFDDFNPKDYFDGSSIKYQRMNDLIDDARNKVTSLNNLNSEVQLKVKEVETYRDETTEWENNALDKLSRLFEKVNQ